MDLERFAALADRLMDQVPPPVLEGLNGGVTVRRRGMRKPGDPEGVYVLGEYITDPVMGRYIVLYFGSFAALFADEPEPVWEAELWSTIKHELRHHLEHQAGERDLDLEDEADVARFREELPPAEPWGAPRRFRLNRPIRRNDT